MATFVHFRHPVVSIGAILVYFHAFSYSGVYFLSTIQGSTTLAAVKTLGYCKEKISQLYVSFFLTGHLITRGGPTLGGPISGVIFTKTKIIFLLKLLHSLLFLTTILKIYQVFLSFSTMRTHAQACICWSKYKTDQLQCE